MHLDHLPDTKSAKTAGGHKISKNVSKWRSKTRFEHKIGKNVSKSVANGRFEHEIGGNMRKSSNYSIPLDAECTSI